jgi:polyisoprenoid-binding protein YceI
MMKRIMAGWALAATLAAPAAYGQDSSTRLTLRPESKLAFDGTSTLHAFTCTTRSIDAKVDVDSRYITESLAKIKRPLTKVEVTIPVLSIKCGKDKMDQNMYKALREAEFPTIRYVLTSYELVDDSSTADRFVAKTMGMLTIAGKEKEVAMRVEGRRAANGVAQASATIELLMTDFGIKPPVLFLGTLKVGNKLVLKFDLMADRAAAAAVGIKLPE